MRAVLFDLDGTLIDTTDLILASFAHTFGRHGGNCPPRDALVATFGRSLPEALLEFARARGVSEAEALVVAMLDTYREHNAEHHDALVRPFPGVAELVSSLHQRGVRLGVVTSKREGTARQGLALYGLTDYFDVMVFHDDTDRHKPEPDPLILALERLETDPSDAAYVGDSVHDVAAGRAAGVLTIAAAWGPFPREALEAARPDAIADVPADVLSLTTTSACADIHRKLRRDPP